jgi:hypothetical protein
VCVCVCVYEMGLETEVREWLHTFPYFSPHIQKRCGHPPHSVVVEDVLVRLHTFMGRFGGNFMYTGEQLYDDIMAPAKRLFSEGNTQVYIALIDNQSIVPSRKWPTQKKRSAKRSFPKGETENKEGEIEEYPSDVLITMDGVVYPVSGKTELIDIRRLIKTRNTRRVLCEFIASKLLTDDMDWRGVVLFDYADQKQGPVLSGSPGQRIPDFIHPFGEADMMAAFWSWVFRDHDQLHVSTDTDWIAILSMCLSVRDDPAHSKQIWLHQKPGMYINMNGMHDAILSAGLTTKGFILICILGGTDFHVKTTLFRGRSNRDIICALTQNPRYLDRIVIPKKYSLEWKERWEPEVSLHMSAEHDVDHGITKCLAMVIAALATITSPPKKRKQKVGEETKSKSSYTRKPNKCTSDDIVTGIDSALWNLHYWSFNWATIVIPPPIDISSSSSGMKDKRRRIENVTL